MVYVAGSSELYHHGILGQKWGVRRYQNPDGSYTTAGRKRYGIGSESGTENIRISRVGSSVKETAGKVGSKAKETVDKAGNKAIDVKNKAKDKWNNMSPETKKKLAIGATVAVTATIAAVYLKNHPEKIVDGAAFISKKAFELKNQSIKLALPNAAAKGKAWAKKKATEAGKKAIKEAKKTAVKAGGAVALKKIKDEYEKNVANNQNLDKYTKEGLKVIYENTTNTISNKTGNSSSSSNSSGTSSSAYKKMKEAAGSPSMKGKIDKQTPEWQSFINSVPQDKKSVIKSLANDGYSYDQLRKAVNA